MLSAAPAASARCGGGKAWWTIQMALPAAAAAVFVVWIGGLWCACRPEHSPAAWAWLGLLAGLAAGGVSLLIGWGGRTGCPGPVLMWDGRQWQLQGAGVLSRPPQVRLDLQNWLLLELPGLPVRLRWQAVHRTGPPEPWHRLRVALYCAAPPPDRASAG